MRWGFWASRSIPVIRQTANFTSITCATLAGQFQSVIAEYQASATDPNHSDPATERILLTVNQVSNFTNHKAGQLAFGADGFLYFGLGDGGSGGDPFGHGQNTQILLGKMMRIDVNSTSPGRQYAIPPDNPFAAGGGLPEIYAFGFRNPWRFSFDLPSGRLFVADVGQDSFEEIDIVQKGSNYGWNIMEGDHCFNPPSGCNMAGLSLPITEISHPEGEAVIGGFVYHGQAISGLAGMYVFGDLNGKIWALTENPCQHVYAFTAHGCRIQHQFFWTRRHRRVVCSGYFGGTGIEDRADVKELVRQKA